MRRPRVLWPVGGGGHCSDTGGTGWLEHDGEEIWTAVNEVIATTLAQCNAQPSQIAAVGITNQRETTIVWDKRTGKPLCNASTCRGRVSRGRAAVASVDATLTLGVAPVVWSDTRTLDICEALWEDGGQNRFKELTGLPVVPYFSGTKLKWILDNVAGYIQLELSRAPSCCRRAHTICFCVFFCCYRVLWLLTRKPVHAKPLRLATRCSAPSIRGWCGTLLAAPAAACTSRM